MGSSSACPFRKALVLANPIAGRGRARKAAEELAAGLAGLGTAAELHFTSGPGDARERAAKGRGDVDLVVSVGGDGTLGEVLAGVGDSGVPVAVLPAGTANVMSLDLALPHTVGGTLEVIERGRTAMLDTARVNGKKLSFLVTGIGFEAMVVREFEARRRGAVKKSAYVGAALRVLARYAPPSLEVEVDGRKLPGRFAQVIASNVVHYAGLHAFSDDRSLDDGLFEVYFFPKGSRASLLGYGLRALLKGLPGGSCTRMRARRLRVVSERPVACEVDGDAFGETPVELAVHPVQSRVVVP